NQHHHKTFALPFIDSGREERRVCVVLQVTSRWKVQLERILRMQSVLVLFPPVPDKEKALHQFSDRRSAGHPSIRQGLTPTRGRKWREPWSIGSNELEQGNVAEKASGAEHRHFELAVQSFPNKSCDTSGQNLDSRRLLVGYRTVASAAQTIRRTWVFEAETSSFAQIHPQIASEDGVKATGRLTGRRSILAPETMRVGGRIPETPEVKSIFKLRFWNSFQAASPLRMTFQGLHNSFRKKKTQSLSWWLCTAKSGRNRPLHFKWSPMGSLPAIPHPPSIYIHVAPVHKIQVEIQVEIQPVSSSTHKPIEPICLEKSWGEGITDAYRAEGVAANLGRIWYLWLDWLVGIKDEKSQVSSEPVANAWGVYSNFTQYKYYLQYLGTILSIRHRYIEGLNEYQHTHDEYMIDVYLATFYQKKQMERTNTGLAYIARDEASDALNQDQIVITLVVPCRHARFKNSDVGRGGGREWRWLGRHVNGSEVVVCDSRSVRELGASSEQGGGERRSGGGGEQGRRAGDKGEGEGGSRCASDGQRPAMLRASSRTQRRRRATYEERAGADDREACQAVVYGTSIKIERSRPLSQTPERWPDCATQYQVQMLMSP
ncbi:hypothetical protein C8R45DRAFT_1182473, partial [Mycena sanguinolenta]